MRFPADASARADYAADVVATGYGPLRASVMRAVHGAAGSVKMRLHVNDADLDEYYNQAWQALYETLRSGEEIENLTGYLVRVMLNRTFDEMRSPWSTHVVPGDLVTESPLSDLSDEDRAAGEHSNMVVHGGVEDADYAEAIDRRALVRHLRAQMEGRLTQRECQAATLCLIQGWTRPEAARLLGIPDRRMERIMDIVMRKLPSIAAPVAAQSVCPSRAVTIRAYALGRIDVTDARYAEAVSHVAGCSDCARFCAAVRNLAAIMPPVTLPIAFAPHSATLVHLNTMLSDTWSHAPHLLGWHVVGTKGGASATAIAQTAGAGAGASTSAAGGALLVTGTTAKVVATCAAAVAVCLAGTAAPFGGSATPHRQLAKARVAHLASVGAPAATPPAPALPSRPSPTAPSGLSGAGSSATTSTAAPSTTVSRPPRTMAANSAAQFGFEGTGRRTVSPTQSATTPVAASQTSTSVEFTPTPSSSQPATTPAPSTAPSTQPAQARAASASQLPSFEVPASRH